MFCQTSLIVGICDKTTHNVVPWVLFASQKFCRLARESLHRKQRSKYQCVRGNTRKASKDRCGPEYTRFGFPNRTLCSCFVEWRDLDIKVCAEKIRLASTLDKANHKRIRRCFFASKGTYQSKRCSIKATAEKVVHGFGYYRFWRLIRYVFIVVAHV